MPTGLALGRPGRDEQGRQVFLARVGFARECAGLPVAKRLVTAFRIRQGGAQPGVEGL